MTDANKRILETFWKQSGGQTDLDKLGFESQITFG